MQDSVTTLVLANPSGGEVSYPINRIDSKTRLQMIEPELQSWPDTFQCYTIQQLPDAIIRCEYIAPEQCLRAASAEIRSDI